MTIALRNGQNAHSFSSLTLIQTCCTTKELLVCLVINIFSDMADWRDNRAPRCHRGFKPKQKIIND
jgi:hypothetical protein